MNEKVYQQAVDAGASARRAGKPRKPPMYAMGRHGEVMRDAWYRGYDEADERIKGERRR